MFGDNYFGIVDYIVLLVSLLICLLVGIYYAYFSQHTNEELLVGSRSMSILPIAASIMVSFFSAVTIIGYPAEIYSFGVEIYGQAIFQALGIIVAALFVVPFFYPMKITSIYEYLELRYESGVMRRMGAIIFIFEQLSLAGMILYAPAMALESFLGLPLWLSVFGIGICGTVYTSIGGIKAVVWTDAFQFVVLVVGLVSIMVKAVMEVGGIGETFSIAYNNGRLKLFDFKFDPFMRHNVWNFILGSGVMQIMRTAGHQVLVQRYMSLPNVSNAKKSLLISVPLKFIVMTIMCLTGIALYSANAGCDPVLSGRIAKHDQIVTLFVVEKFAEIPGSLGLFTAAIFSAVLSSISSQLNSLAAVTWQDFLSDLTFFKKMGPKSQANTSRLLSFLYGLAAMGVVFIVKNMSFMYAASFAVTGVTSGVISGVLSMGAFFPFINKIGAFSGVGFGLVSMLYVCALGFIHQTKKIALPYMVDQCEGNFTMNWNATQSTVPTAAPEELGFPDSLHSLSYIMYPFVGSALSVIVGTLVSVATGGATKKQMNQINPKYVHSVARKLFLTEQPEIKDEKEMETFISNPPPLPLETKG